MRKTALLLVTILMLGVVAMPAFAAEEKKADEAALQAQLVYTPPTPAKTLSDSEKSAALKAVAAESYAMPAIITFGMFAVVLITIGGGVVAYRRA